MVVYYTRKYSSLLERCGLRRNFMALEVHRDVGVLVFLNTNEHYPIDAIIRVEWHSNLKVTFTLLVDPNQPNRIESVRFEKASELCDCLEHLDIESKRNAKGQVISGVFTNTMVPKSEAFATVLLSSMKSLKKKASWIVQ
ncbi:hypothetical protein THRCLA_20716 [Thraustotheca clavata]|uniref:Uncharacterized protein n=1 Tax=Thraustotheca clavata TaxID=74557 RepID=A0A1W0A4A9_9STRA|nr:hypothetical protein THRCLA_20716 [Thraustotheca clavata]